MSNKTKVVFIMVISLFFSLGLAGCGGSGGIGASNQTARIKMIGSSMEPNFSNGTILKMNPVGNIGFQRGAVVDFAGPDGNMYLKRIVGLPAETVEIHDQGVYINGNLLNESYSTNPPDYEMEAVTLGSGEYFMLGDSRPQSADSHAFGPVSGANIKYILP